jgi:Protein of unknown function (DUF2849)
MAKASDPQMLTAHRLVDGDVLYWKAGQWVLSLRDADVFADAKDAQAAVAAAQKYVADNVVVNPYLFDVKMDAHGIHPVKEREIIRAAGPTVRFDLGKQAEQKTEHGKRGSKKDDTPRKPLKSPPYEI